MLPAICFLLADIFTNANPDLGWRDVVLYQLKLSGMRSGVLVLMNVSQFPRVSFRVFQSFQFIMEWFSIYFELDQCYFCTCLQRHLLIVSRLSLLTLAILKLNYLRCWMTVSCSLNDDTIQSLRSLTHLFFLRITLVLCELRYSRSCYPRSHLGFAPVFDRC